MNIRDLTDDLEQHQARERDEFVGRPEESHWATGCPTCDSGPCYLFFRRGVWMCGTCCWTKRDER